MSLDIMTLAEATTVDGRGALALVGINQRVMAPAKLPFNIKQQLVMTLSDETPESPGRSFSEFPGGIVSIRVLDPGGSATFATSEEIKETGEKRWLDLPLIQNIVIEIDIRGDSYGVYIVEVKLKASDSEEITRYFPIYIVSPQVALSLEKGPTRVFEADDQVGTSASA